MAEEETEGPVTVRIALYPEDGPDKVLRQIGYGITPFLLIEPDYDEDTDTTTWEFVGSWIEDMGTLVEHLEGALDVLKAAIEQADDQ